MTFITVRQNPMYRQMSFEELLYDTGEFHSLITNNKTNTRTYCVEVTSKLLRRYNINHMMDCLSKFNDKYEDLINRDKHELYRSFKIPKRSGGLRQIDAPNEELSNALRELKGIFENDFKALYHTTAFAYVKGRSTIDSIKRHQANESKWFAKFDLSNFFGSTTPQFVMKMFSIIFPFSEIMKNPVGKTELETALSLCFLDGGLPQGTPISPTITNIMMIPIDHVLSNKLREYNGVKYIYTRYADDFLVSSKVSFSFKDIEKFIQDTLASYDAPFRINESKTRYGSSSGANWNLGVMLNKDNKITVGHKKKRALIAMLHNYVKDKMNGITWELNDLQVMEGYRSYCSMVEKESIDNAVNKLSKKFNIDVVAMIKADIRGY